MPKAARSRAQQRLLEWALLATTLLGMVVWLSAPTQLSGPNHLLQDIGLRSLARAPHPDIVIVAVDDRSISAIGRWPWRRALHAQLLQTISAQQPKAIGLDILFSEADTDNPLDDALLAQAIHNADNVVLPVLQRSYAGMGMSASQPPLESFAQAAAALGHVHIAPDGDGVVRSLYLREGPESAQWSHFSLAMLCAGQATGTPCTATPAETETTPTWTMRDRELIAFGGGPGHFPTYSYIDVLQGKTPPQAFEGKYVLVGAVASGLGDLFATPVSTGARLMPGVEVVGHVLDGQLAQVRLQPASPGLNLLFNLLPVVLALGALWFLGPLGALLTSAGLALLTLALAILLPGWAGVQFAPAAALLGLVLAYPLWSWRRLSAAAQYLRVEMERLQQEHALAHRPAPTSGDFLDRHINAVESASRQLRDLHQFVSTSLQQLPSPNFVCDAQGHILLLNEAAQRHLHLPPQTHAQAGLGKSITHMLHDLCGVHDGQPLLTAEKLRSGQLPAQCEGLDAKGRSLLLLSKPFTEFANVGWLITLVDMSDIRRALRQRDQALHFISHDIRAPNASILTLLEMHRASPEQLATPLLIQRIERYARNSLDMAENFVRLASAQTQEYQQTELDLVALLHETADDAWALARERQVHITLHNLPDEAPCTGDRPLLGRAIANLLHNAVKFSPESGIVQCSITASPHHWTIHVRDQGPGIAKAKQKQLFAPFARLHEQSHPQINGIGLGLALVHTVVQRHGGELEVESDTGCGAEFRMHLPRTTQMDKRVRAT